jgi:16S rRNA C1402 (ribose-2'-O) methylase RsmI
LALSGVAGLQFFYMFYLERLEDERKKRLRELEHHSSQLVLRLEEAEKRLAVQEKIINDFYQEQEEDEAWADVIEEQ